MSDEETRAGAGHDARREGEEGLAAGFGERGVAERGEAGRETVKRRRRGSRRRVPAEEAGAQSLTPTQRLLLLDVWLRSKLPASEFSELTCVSAHTLYGWKKKFDEEGPAGLVGKKRGAPKGSRLPEPTRRAILLLKRAHPAWGQDRIHDELVRAEGLEASPGAIGRVLEEEGYVVEEGPAPRHEPPVRRFEVARVNQLWLMSSRALCAVGTSRSPSPPDLRAVPSRRRDLLSIILPFSAE